MLLDNSQNPYRGLQAFEEEHSKLFFGRQALTEKLYQQVCQHPLTVVLGSSGAGKSSLVKAGLIPYIKKLIPQNSLEMLFGKSLRKQWYITAPCRPGESPLKALNVTFSPDSSLTNTENKIEEISTYIGAWLQQHPQSKLLLVIDQAEELFTMCHDQQEREDFLELLADVINDYGEKLRIVLTLRSDFEPEFKDTALKKYWYEGRFIVPRMKPEELHSCIKEPASAQGVYFESSSLVDKLIDEAVNIPEALPLLSFTLSELYIKHLKAVKERTRKKKVITQADYEQLGGLPQSLNRKADSEYEGLVKVDPEYKRTIPNVMLRMLAVTKGKLAPRRVFLSELEYPEPENSRVKEVIKRFTAARLLVKGRDFEGNHYVEPAHDALVNGWQKLLLWKQEQKETIILQRWLRPAVVQWESQQKSKFLWNSHPLLDSLKKVLSSDDNWLNPVEAEFVRRSIRHKHKNKALRGVFATGASVLALGTVFFIRLSQDDKLMAQACKFVGNYLPYNPNLEDSDQAGDNGFTYPYICKDVPVLIASPMSNSSSAATSPISITPSSPTTSPISVTPSPTTSPISATPSPTTSPVSVTPSPTTSPISVTPSPTTSPISVTPSPTTSPISVTPSPTTSPISVTPSPATSPLTAKKFLPSLQSTPKEYYTRGSDQNDAKSIHNSTKIINNPNSSNIKKKNAYINRGVVYFRQKKYQLAIKDYTRVIKDWDHHTEADIAPTKSQLINAYINRGIAYSSLQEPEHQLAIKDYDRAIAIKPDYADAYINRGIAYSGLGKYEMAVKDYIKAINITPQNPDIYYAKAFTQSLMQGKKQRAMYNYQKAADLYQEQGKPSYSKNALKKIEELRSSLDE